MKRNVEAHDLQALPRPVNIVLIVAEHWRGDSLGRLGHPVAETPHLDELGSGGVTFSSAFSPCPSCIAARRSLMTGLAPRTHGMVGYQDGCPWPYRITLAGELTRAGYQTINIGKTHFHPSRLRLGFEELVVPEDYVEWIDRATGMQRARMAHGIHANSWMARASHLPEPQMEESWFTDQAIRHIAKRDPTRPFFLCLSYNGVHPPWCPPQSYFDLFMERPIPPPVVGAWAARDEAMVEHPPSVNARRARLPMHLNHRARAAYYAYMAYVDAQIGRLIEYLSRQGLARNTLFVFTADHGEMLGDHHLWRKTYAYDPSARIPLIVRPPALWQMPRNLLNAEPVGLEDIMPTLLEVAGVGVPAALDGQSMIPLLQGRSSAWRNWYHHEHAPCYTHDNAYQCLTDKEWKYIWNPIDGKEQLFRRNTDPLELHDLAADSSVTNVLSHWRETLARHLAERPENLSDGIRLTPNAVPVWSPRDAVERD